MNDDHLKNLFSKAQQPADTEAKQRHIDAAAAEFDKVFAADDQGNESPARQKENNTLSFPTNEQRQSEMTTIQQTKKRNMYTGFASAAVLVLGVSLVVNRNLLIDPVATDTDLPLVEPLIESVSPKETNINTDFYDYWKTPAENVKQAESAKESQRADLARRWERNAESEALASKPQLQGRQTIKLTPRDAGQSEMRLEHAIAPTALIADSPMIVVPAENRDSFERFDANPVNRVTDNPVSTFSIDVDTASYSFVRRQLMQGYLPNKDAVRLEEMVNYFPYDYPGPEFIGVPFKANVSVVPSPWNDNNRLVHIGIKGYELPVDETVRTNLVFLLDVSGSMSSQDKLPLVKSSLTMLLSELHPEDTIAIAVYAGAAGTVLEPTKVKDAYKIREALNRLEAGGSTAGGEGIKLAYELAESSFVQGGINRILLATDGDFNVGISDPNQLQSYVERKRDSGVYLSVLGFGQGNYQDALMQKLAQNGNGIASYIDSLWEARKVLVDEARSQLFTIANDVKIQVEFNPETVSEYRLLGYETRALNQEDFNNDKVDAGEIGSGHTVTAIYEITPRGAEGLIDESRYSEAPEIAEGRDSEYGFLKLRYKQPGEQDSQLISEPIQIAEAEQNSEVMFSVAVAGFAQLLIDAKYTGDWDYRDVVELALEHRGEDRFGYRIEFVRLAQAAMRAHEMR